MKHISTLPLIAIMLLGALTSAVHAQRESFDASTVRIIESKAITDQLGKSGAYKTIERKGAGLDGKLIVIIALEQSISFDAIFFEFDSTKLRNKSSEQQLHEMLKALQSKELKGKRFLIEGHTCDIGTGDYNLNLSAARAQAVKDYLVGKGIKPELLAILGCGETEPAVPLNPKGTPAEIETQRARNRRVVLRQMPELVSSQNRK